VRTHAPANKQAIRKEDIGRKKRREERRGEEKRRKKKERFDRRSYR